MANITGTTTTSTNSSPVFTSNKITNINTNWIYNPPSPSPFSLAFKWDEKSVTIELKNGNDIFKLAQGFMKFLDENEIEYEVKTTGKKKKK